MRNISLKSIKSLFFPLIGLIILIPLIIWALYVIGYYWNGIPTTLEAGDLLSYSSGVLAFLGTTFLGVISYKQNQAFQNFTRRSTLPEITVNNEITILAINRPFTGEELVCSHSNKCAVTQSLNSKWHSFDICLDLLNISDNGIFKINLEHISLKSNDEAGVSFININCKPESQYSMGISPRSKRQLELLIFTDSNLVSILGKKLFFHIGMSFRVEDKFGYSIQHIDMLTNGMHSISSDKTFIKITSEGLITNKIVSYSKFE